MSFKITAESDLWESRGTFTLLAPHSQPIADKFSAKTVTFSAQKLRHFFTKIETFSA
jgi:hypothetical protein